MELAQGILATARAIGADPLDLATVISYETGGTFDPAKRGPTTQWGQHRGLIQFGEPQARQYGVDWNDPLGSQLGPDGAIAKYFRSSGYQPGMGLLDLYSTVNAGRPGLYNRSDANNGGAPGTVRDKVETQMAGHRRNAERLFGGAGNNTMVGGLAVSPRAQPDTMEQPMNLFGMQPQPQDDTPTSLLGRIQQGARSGSLWDGIAVGFNTLRHRPDPGIPQMAQSRANAREQAKAVKGKQAEQARRDNSTLQYLRASGAPDEYLALAQADPAAAINAWERQRQQQAEFAREDALLAQQGPEQTALMRNVEYIMSRDPSLTFEDALQVARSGQTINLDAPQIGTIPAGQELVKDPETGALRLRDIPGGPSDKEAEAAEKAQRGADRSRQRYGEIVMEDIGRIRGMLEGGRPQPVTGTSGGMMARIPGTEAADARALAETIKANIGFDRLAEMRRESPTGGALGNVTERELATLQAVLGNLEFSQSKPQLLENLARLEKVYRGILNKIAQTGDGTLIPADQPSSAPRTVDDILQEYPD